MSINHIQQARINRFANTLQQIAAEQQEAEDKLVAIVDKMRSMGIEPPVTDDHLAAMKYNREKIVEAAKEVIVEYQHLVDAEILKLRE